MHWGFYFVFAIKIARKNMKIKLKKYNIGVRKK